MPSVPSLIICKIWSEGHGVTGAGFVEVPVLQVPLPLWSCIKPGFLTPLSVVGTRTQPLLSCMTIARMNRESTPVEFDTDTMES